MTLELFPQDNDDFKDTVVEIARYLQDDEIPCLRCGVVHDVAALTIERRGAKRLMAKASCPDCGKYIKFLKTSTFPTLYCFNERRPRPVYDLSDSIISWYLRKGTPKQKQIAGPEFAKRALSV